MVNNSLVGQKFGHWTVLDWAQKPEAFTGVVKDCLCLCVCGRVKTVKGYALLHNTSRSCGCKKTDYTHPAKQHGLSQTVEYQTWKNMHNRCSNPKDASYPYYGEKGIAVCPEWKSFETFYADMGKRPPNMTLDRVKGAEGYSRANCRWATKDEQMSNLSRNVFVTYKGFTKTVAQWSKFLDVHRSTMAYRLQTGVNIETALPLAVGEIQLIVMPEADSTM